MAEKQIKGGHPETAAPENFVFSGYTGEAQEYASVFIDPATDELNQAGLDELKKQKQLRRNAGLEDREELECRVYLPFPQDGMTKYVRPDFLKAWSDAWEAFAKPRGITVDFDLDKFILGQMRIDINRDFTTTEAYKRYTVLGVKANAKAKKAAAKKAKVNYTTAL